MRSCWTLLAVLALLADPRSARPLAASPVPVAPPQQPPRPPAPPQAPLAAPTRAAGPADAAALASPYGVVTAPDTGLPLPGTRVTLRTVAVLPTGIGPGLGEYQAQRAAAELRWSRNLSSSFQLATDLTLERGRYRFDDEAALLPAGTGTLGEDYSLARLSLGGSWRLTRSLGLTLGASLRAGWMDGADVGEGLQPGFIAAVRLRLFGSSDILLGVTATQGLEGDPYLLPIAGMGGALGGDRKRWRIEARGPGASFVYELTPRLSLGAFAGYERRDLRLADDAREPGGVLREQRLQAGVEVGWLLRRGSTLYLSGGWAAWNRLVILDRDGDTVLEEDTDPAPFVQLEWSLRM